MVSRNRDRAGWSGAWGRRSRRGERPRFVVNNCERVNAASRGEKPRSRGVRGADTGAVTYRERCDDNGKGAEHRRRAGGDARGEKPLDENGRPGRGSGMKEAPELESGVNRREAVNACGRNEVGLGARREWTRSSDVARRVRNPGSGARPRKAPGGNEWRRSSGEARRRRRMKPSGHTPGGRSIGQATRAWKQAQIPDAANQMSCGSVDIQDFGKPVSNLRRDNVQHR
jgi:hypothetical protein